MERDELEIPEEVSELRFRPAQSDIVTQTRRQTSLHARLLGIDLPRMEVDADRALLPTVDIADCPARIGIGEYSKISATAKGSAFRADLQGGKREFC